MDDVPALFGRVLESAAAWDGLATLYNARMMSRVRSILRERTSSTPGPCGFRK